MNKQGFFRGLVVAGMLTGLSWSAAAEWTLQPTASSVQFVSVKKGSVVEVHHFTDMQGTLADTGAVNLSINLASVETDIPIRNERMQSMLFETEKYPSLTLKTSIDPEVVKKLKVGETTTQEMTLEVSMHGMTHSYPVTMKLVRLCRRQLQASSVSAVVVKAEDFGLESGIEQLREVAKLPSIGTSVPVTASLIFEM